VAGQATRLIYLHNSNNRREHNACNSGLTVVTAPLASCGPAYSPQGDAQTGRPGELLPLVGVNIGELCEVSEVFLGLVGLSTSKMLTTNNFMQSNLILWTLYSLSFLPKSLY
jgi:hypothetical protein